MIAVVTGAIPQAVHLIPEQLPIAPITPPLPGAEALGTLSWDLPGTIVYTPYEEVIAVIEILNPTSEDKLYGMSYYFLNSQNAIVAEDYIYFLSDSTEFSAFLLPAHGETPMVSTLSFKAPTAGYTFGLRMLLLEMVDSSAVVIQETNRLEVSLVSGGPSPIWGLLVLPLLMIPAVAMAKK